MHACVFNFNAIRDHNFDSQFLRNCYFLYNRQALGIFQHLSFCGTRYLNNKVNSGCAVGLEQRENNTSQSTSDFLAARIDTLAIWRRPPWNAHVDPTSRGFYEERISGVTSQDLQIFTRNADVLPSSSSAPINVEACCLQTVLHDFWVCFVTSF